MFNNCTYIRALSAVACEASVVGYAEMRHSIVIDDATAEGLTDGSSSSVNCPGYEH